MKKSLKFQVEIMHQFSYSVSEAENVIVIMGSGRETVIPTSEFLRKNGEKTGVVNFIRLDLSQVKIFISVLPNSVKKIAVLDRTKEPGSNGEPMYQDVLVCLTQVFLNGNFRKMPKLLDR